MFLSYFAKYPFKEKLLFELPMLASLGRPTAISSSVDLPLQAATTFHYIIVKLISQILNAANKNILSMPCIHLVQSFLVRLHSDGGEDLLHVGGGDLILSHGAKQSSSNVTHD